VLVDLEAEVTARELIRLAVTEQVRLLRGDAARCRRALDRQYLSAADIREQAPTGVVRMPAAVTVPSDVAAEIARPSTVPSDSAGTLPLLRPARTG